MGIKYNESNIVVFILAARYHGYTDVFVSLDGDDSESCGMVSRPCKSISRAVRQVDWGGHIFLDGTGTERHPYECRSNYEQLRGILVQKDLTIEGFKSTPYISCSSGFHFDNSTSQELTIVLSGIVFRQTPLMFQDCDLRIFNCSFQDTSIALNVQITNKTSVHLNIHGSSFFKNNTSCMEIVFHNDARNQGRFLILNISETKFLENGFHKQRFARGVMTIKSETAQPSSLHVQISCKKITFVRNYGHFINLDLPTAVTNETYNDFSLVNNTISEFINVPLGRKARVHHVVNSLFNSITKKTHVKFNNLRCSHNHLLRCIRIHSDEAQVEIHNSSFYGQRLTKDRGGAMYLNSTVGGSLVLFNCSFRRNIATGGGALFVLSKNGTLTLNITHVNFTQCAAKTYGCAILVGDLKSSATYKLIANFREIRVRDCFDFQGGCYSVRLILSNGKVAINDSSWTDNIKSSTPMNALMIENYGGNTDVTISGCIFVPNIAVAPGVVRIKGQRQATGRVTIENSIMSNKQDRGYCALRITPEFSIKLTNVVLTSFALSLLIIGLHPRIPSEARPFYLSISNCTFLDNSCDISVNLHDPTHVELRIENTIFTSRYMTRKNVGLYFITRPLDILPFSNAFIKIHNVTFQASPCNLLSLLFEGNKTLQIQRSVFRNGICNVRNMWVSGVYETSAGGISVLTTPDKVQSPGCVNKPTTKEIHPLWSYRTHVIFEDNIFEDNTGLIAGAVYISNGYTTFQRCTFLNNFAIQHSGHVYSAYGTGKVDFKDCSFASKKMNTTINNTEYHKSTIFYSESGGPINIHNTTMVSTATERNSHPVIDISHGGYVHMDNNTSIQCAIGSKLLLDNTTHFVYTEKDKSFCRINVTVLKYSCQLCSPGFYSIQKGVSRGLILNNTVECLQCPFGASCIERNIAANPNFWGYPISTDPPSLSFIACPEHYCRQPTSGSEGYNSCQGNRNGTLCGKCSPGYSETLFSAECRKNEECNSYWFWISAILLTTGLALYLLIKPPILFFLGKQILWFKRRQENQVRADLGPNDEHSESGYIKITFYFYQAAELLMVGSMENLLEKIPFIYIVIAAFNFQVRSINKGLGCPFVGLTAVTKELFLSGAVFVTMTDIVVIYCVHSVINMLRKKEKPSLIHYMAVVMEVLLLGYERLAETSLKLLHCVSIGSGKWLFIDANVPCMQWWQYILLAFIVVFVVPFIIVLYCGSSKLYRASITANEFLASCMLPLPFLIYWFYKQKLTRRGDNFTSLSVPVVNRDVLEILHGPFRPPHNEDKGTLYWESVLIGRRFILLACQAFISNLMLRMVCMVGACFLITLHHVLKTPYRDPMANKAETLSLATLSMIAVINLTKGTLISFGITIDGPYRSYMETLEWFEVCALAFVPALVCILATLAILSQLASLTLLNKKSGAIDTKFETVYVAPFGQDSQRCGTQDQPCQSIAQAVRQVDWDGEIYLNGSGTEEHPYQCVRDLTDGYYPAGININKSLTMKGVYATPHVLCVEGFHFQKANDEQLTSRFELSGIAFWQTPLSCEDCHYVKILNCSFHDTLSTALRIEMHNIATFRLDIQGFSSFHNNSQCISLLLLDNMGNDRRSVAINISGTYFEKNGFYGVQRSERGVMKIASKETKTLKLVEIHVFCDKVKCVDNQGPFINLNVSTAVTNETYKDVELHLNRLPSWKNSLDRKQKLTTVHSFFSHKRGKPTQSSST
ncbi:hypothetical protein OS493_027347 [Desmophyllum pertusum]|uniref:Uncharacterized protein n=1 Tax=Desmophyllum pertusum TaxID=174260 RepID=A0A9X0CR64_9CNID|nr:hypothetical protein OS493_027347 [Desmophyllum pertusum]